MELSPPFEALPPRRSFGLDSLFSLQKLVLAHQNARKEERLRHYIQVKVMCEK